MGQEYRRRGPIWLAALNDICDQQQHHQQHRPGESWSAAGFGAHSQSHRHGHGPGFGGPPPWLAGLFGMGRPEGRGPRVRRGDVRAAILDILRAAGEREESLNGYQVIQQITERTGGAWKPSPGSVYPTLQQLEDEGLVEYADAGSQGGRRTLRLSEAGATYCVDNAAELDAVWAPFETTAPQPAPHADLKAEIGQVMSAVWQIVSSGDDSQKRAAIDVLVTARRALYGILADGPQAEGDDVVDGEQ